MKEKVHAQIRIEIVESGRAAEAHRDLSNRQTHPVDNECAPPRRFQCPKLTPQEEQRRPDLSRKPC